MKPRKKTAFVAPVGVKGFEFTLKAELDPKELGAELQRLRKNCLVTVSDLADRMRWNRQNVHRLERGGDGREPTMSSVSLYVRMLGFNLVLSARPKRSLRRAAAKHGEGGKREPAGEGGAKTPQESPGEDE